MIFENWIHYVARRIKTVRLKNIVCMINDKIFTMNQKS